MLPWWQIAAALYALLEGVHIRSRQHRSDGRRVGSQRSPSYRQVPLVHQRRDARRNRRLFPLRRRVAAARGGRLRGARCAARLSRAPGLGLAIIGTNLLSPRHLEFRAGTPPQAVRAGGDVAFDMAILNRARRRRAVIAAWLLVCAPMGSARPRGAAGSRSKTKSRRYSSTISPSTWTGRPRRGDVGQRSASASRQIRRFWPCARSGSRGESSTAGH